MNLADFGRSSSCLPLRDMPARLPGGQSGFTLLEVLAALIIVSLGMLGVIEAVSQTASNGSYLRDKTLAHWVAMNQLTKTRLESRPPKIDETSDEIEMADRRWRWTMKITQSPVESVRRIDISVRLADAVKTSSLASVTGFYGSAVAPPGAIVVMWQGNPADTPGGPGNNTDQKNSDDSHDSNASSSPANPPDSVEPPDNGAGSDDGTGADNGEQQ